MIERILPRIEKEEEFDRMKGHPEIFALAMKEIALRHRLPSELTQFFRDGTNIVASYGGKRVIKLFSPFLREQFDVERTVLNHLNQLDEAKLPVDIPQVEYVGELDQWPYLVMSRVEGLILEVIWENLDFENRILLMRQIGTLIHAAHTVPTQGLKSIDCHWDQFVAKQISQCFVHHSKQNMPEILLSKLQEYLHLVGPLIPSDIHPVFLTGEYTPMNLMVSEKSGKWHLTGMIDFGDSMLGFHEYDLLGPAAFLSQGNSRLLRELFTSYGYSLNQLNPILSRRLTALMLIHRYSSLNIQIRIEKWQSKVKTFEDFERLVWSF